MNTIGQSDYCVCVDKIIEIGQRWSKFHNDLINTCGEVTGTYLCLCRFHRYYVDGTEYINFEKVDPDLGNCSNDKPTASMYFIDNFG